MSWTHAHGHVRQSDDGLAHSDGLATLLVGITDPDRDVRQESALALGESADEEAIDAVLAQLWVEPDFFVRETLTWTTVRIGESAIGPVTKVLGSGVDSGVKIQALHVLSKIADPSTLADITPFIRDADPEVAAKARWALSRIGDERSVPLLGQHLGIGDAEAQNALTDVLASFGSAAVPVMIDALAHERPGVRRHAAEVLGHVGSPHADHATSALGSAAAGRDADVAISALMALGSLNNAQASAEIQRAASAPDPRVRGVAERLAARSTKQSRLQAARAARLARNA